MRLVAISALVLTGCLQASDSAAQASWSGTVTLNFDSVTGTGCVDATSHLGRFGVTVTQQSRGTIVSTGTAGQCFHGDVVAPSSPRALYVLNNQPVRFSLNFDRALDSVRFVRARLNAGGPSGVNTVGWTATAYSATGATLAQVGEDARSAYSPNFIASAAYTVLTEGGAQFVPATPVVARGWAVVEGPRRVFRVEMPGAPVYKLDPAGSISSYRLLLGDITYYVQTFTLASDGTDRLFYLEGLLAASASARLRSGHWTTTMWTTLQGAPAVEATGIELGGSEMRSFMTAKGRQIYWLYYTGPRGTTRSEDAERFFNSLRISP